VKYDQCFRDYLLPFHQNLILMMETGGPRNMSDIAREDIYVSLLLLLLLLLTANGFSPGGSGTTIRQQTNNTLTTIRQQTIHKHPETGKNSIPY
jgi:hypothetical protein